MKLRQCTDCGQTFHESEEYFYWKRKPTSETPGAFVAKCKACIRAKTRQWTASNHGRKKQADKDYSKRHPESRQAAQKRYLKRHPERRKQTAKTYRDKNSQHHTEWARDWRKRNPHLVKGVKSRRRARENAVPATFTAHEWQATLEYFGNKCAVCGRSDLKLAADHWIPVTKGGGSTPDNIIPLCQGRRGCNNSKGNKDAGEWLVKKFGERDGQEISRRINQYLKG